MSADKGKVDYGQRTNIQLGLLQKSTRAFAKANSGFSTADNHRQHFKAAVNKDAAELTRFPKLGFIFVD